MISEASTLRAMRLDKPALFRAAAFVSVRSFAQAMAHLLTAPEPLLRLPAAALFRRAILPRLPGALRRRLEYAGECVTLHSGEIGDARELSRVLLVTNELASSGAPKIVVEMAAGFRQLGCTVVVLSPADGPFREPLSKLGVTVIIDRNVLSGVGIGATLGRGFDLAICNTVATDRAVERIGRYCPCHWYIHEVSLLESKLNEATFLRALERAREVWAGSELPAALLRPLRPDVRIVPYGLEAISPGAPAGSRTGALQIGVFGSVEPRKGQDLAVVAFAGLGDLASDVEVTFFGRLMDQEFCGKVLAAADTLPGVSYGGALDYEAYVDRLREMDAILVPSRDDTLPLVSLDALSSGRVLLVSTTVGTSSYIEDGVSGFIASEASVQDLVDMLSRAIRRRSEWAQIGESGRRVFAEAFSKVAFHEHLRTTLEDARSAATRVGGRT